MRNGRYKLAVLATIPLLAAACSNGGGDNGDSADGGGGDLSASLTGAGASFPDPLFQDWIYTYNSDVQPGVDINYQSVGSGAGVEQFLEETVDFGSSEAYLTEEDLAVAAENRGCEAVQFPVVFGSVVIAFSNPDLDGLVLDAQTIADIYSTEITTFDDPAIADLNPDMDLPSDEIVPVHRSDSSGTTAVFSTTSAPRSSRGRTSTARARSSTGPPAWSAASRTTVSRRASRRTPAASATSTSPSPRRPTWPSPRS